MSSFTDENLVQKLLELNNSQQSIQTLSLWLIHHRKHAATITDVWFRELQQVQPNRKLTYIYLANDVIQNSKRKGGEFSIAFSTCMLDAFSHTASESDEKIIGSLKRLCAIWSDRKVFSEELIEQLRETIEMEDPAAKRMKLEAMLALKEDLLDEGTDSPKEPPDAEELVKTLETLENSASSDASVREKIAALPPEVSDVALLQNIKDKSSADRLTKRVNSACLLLGHYNDCLTVEIDERRHLGAKLRDFIAGQKDQLSGAEKRLNEYKSKLDKVKEVRKELKSHIQNLPDLTLLPDVTGGLAPLPSAGDLFNVEKALNI